MKTTTIAIFTTKAVLESQLRLTVDVKGVQTSRELLLETAGYAPDAIRSRPTGGVAELLDQMKKRHTNRRNTEGPVCWLLKSSMTTSPKPSKLFW